MCSFLPTQKKSFLTASFLTKLVRRHEWERVSCRQYDFHEKALNFFPFSHLAQNTSVNKRYFTPWKIPTRSKTLSFLLIIKHAFYYFVPDVSASVTGNGKLSTFITTCKTKRLHRAQDAKKCHGSVSWCSGNKKYREGETLETISDTQVTKFEERVVLTLRQTLTFSSDNIATFVAKFATWPWSFRDALRKDACILHFVMLRNFFSLVWFQCHCFSFTKAG